MKKTIIYYTDNNLEYNLAVKCRKLLKVNSGGIDIIAVSQKPIRHPHGFGKNIVYPVRGRSHLNMYRQILLGLNNTDADIVYLAEHDCCYHPEHFNIEPELSSTFYYNISNYIVNWKHNNRNKGEYFKLYDKRAPLSCLICYRPVLIDALNERISLIENGYTIAKGVKGACEPGINEAHALIKNGVYADLKKRESVLLYCGDFDNENYNIDIRNGQNFSGNRKALKHNVKTESIYSIPYWDRFEKVLKNV